MPFHDMSWTVLLLSSPGAHWRSNKTKWNFLVFIRTEWMFSRHDIGRCSQHTERKKKFTAFLHDGGLTRAGVLWPCVCVFPIFKWNARGEACTTTKVKTSLQWYTPASLTSMNKHVLEKSSTQCGGALPVNKQLEFLNSFNKPLVAWLCKLLSQ